MRFLVLAFSFLILTSQAAAQSEVLASVLNQVRSVKAFGVKPVVVFDLDDTLINTRARNLRILRELNQDSLIRSRFPIEVSVANELQLHEVKYLLVDTLKSKGITNADYLSEAQKFWDTRFFESSYVAVDEPTLGAIAYVREILLAGGQIVYLTGRDAPRMQNGTIENLKALSFPLDGDQAVLLLKPTQQMDDLEFKRQTIESLKSSGSVVAIFENEPANLNLLAEAFPQATPVFLDTIHSPKPDLPLPRAYWVTDLVYKRKSITQFLHESLIQFH